MARKPKAQIPEVRTPAEQVAAAAQEAATKAKKGSLPGFRVEDIVWNDHETHVVKGNQYPCGTWIHSPGQIELLAAAYQMLLKVAEEQGTPVKKIEKVRVGRLKRTKIIVIKPTEATDPNGIKVGKYASSAWINAISVLGPAKLTVATGYRERYTVTFAPDDFPSHPALLINLGKRLERRSEGQTKSEAASLNATEGQH